MVKMRVLHTRLPRPTLFFWFEPLNNHQSGRTCCTTQLECYSQTPKHGRAKPYLFNELRSRPWTMMSSSDRCRSLLAGDSNLGIASKLAPTILVFGPRAAITTTFCRSAFGAPGGRALPQAPGNGASFAHGESRPHCSRSGRPRRREFISARTAPVC